VNLSPTEFKRGNLVERVRYALDACGIDPARLELEITESVMLEDAVGALEVMRTLKQLGIRIAMDDFGTGYSSLTYLKRLPVDTLKIDQSFVRDATHDPNDAEIIRAIVAMARSLQLKVIAEGVETPQQLEFLQGLDCHLYQGYLHSRPLPLHELKRLLS
jgi:EAL domain-containing protein (putative c-di-GMP-specific phosphodiesterase class I)